MNSCNLFTPPPCIKQVTVVHKLWNLFMLQTYELFFYSQTLAVQLFFFYFFVNISLITVIACILGKVKNENIENKCLSGTDVNKLPSNEMLKQTTKKKSKKLLKNKNEVSENNAENIQANNDLELLLSFGKIKKENGKNQLQSKEMLSKLHTNESLKHTLKRKSKKDSKKSLKKKTKNCAISSLITSNVRKNTQKNIQVKTEIISVENQAKLTKRIKTNIDANHSPNPFKTFEKNTNKRFKENKPEIAKKTNPMSKLS